MSKVLLRDLDGKEGRARCFGVARAGRSASGRKPRVTLGFRYACKVSRSRSGMEIAMPFSGSINLESAIDRSRKFIAGEPMNPATKGLAGRL